MSSFFEQNQETFHMCNWGLSIYKLLEETGEATVDEISSKCNIPYSRVNVLLDCLKQDGHIVSRGRKIKRFALRHKDPELSHLWPKEDKAK